MSIIGNIGKANILEVGAADITIKRASGALAPTFGFSTVSTADGESASTSQVIYDSLGAKVNVNINTTLVSKDSTGTSWQYIITSPDSTTGQATGGVGTNTFISAGVLKFDNNGKLIGTPNPTVSIDRSNTGAAPLLQFSMGFSEMNALAANTAPGESNINVSFVNGSEKGTLKDYSISSDGTIIGSFDKGQQRTLGQIVLATFRNTQGLLEHGNNTFVPGASSGLATITAPGNLSAGTIVNSSIELSNVDLSQEFINLISASTSFSASSRVITTSNQLLQELLQSAR
jgi:flagellar hook protein FlgE